KLRRQPMEPIAAARLMETVAQAIGYAHARGVIHRDLKPANILLTQTGEPKVSDFGLAKQLDEEAAGRTEVGAVLGTPNYMPPEQAEGHPRAAPPLADISPLGATLYEMLTGRPPFQGPTVVAIINQVKSIEPVAPSRLQPGLPRDLETICLKCLEKDPAKRYATAANLAADLHRFLAGEPILARPTSVARRVSKWARRQPALAALVGVTVLAGLSLLGSSLWYSARLRVERDRAVENEGQARRGLRQARAAADTLVTELADGIRPIAGTQSRTVERILARAAQVDEGLLQEDPSPPV